MRLRERFWVPVWLAPRAYWTIAIIAMLCAGGAVASPIWWIAIASGVLFAGALIADAITGPRSSAIRIERMTPDPFSLRREGTIAYRVVNTSPRSIRVALIEAPSALLRYDIDELHAHIAAQSEVRLERPITPVSRGSGLLDSLFVTIENAIGLLRRRFRIRQESDFRVYPDLSAVERYGTLHARNRLIEAGLRRMRLRGAGSEVESVREWTPGDPFRSIDWKATARRAKMMVAQYEVERSQNVMIVLDAGRLMMPRVGEQRKIDYAVTAALSVASVASLANDKVGVVAFAGQILRAFAPRPSGRSAARIADEIHDIAPRFEESDYERAFSYVRSHVNKRSLIIFFTDMVDPVSQSSVLAQIGTLCRRHLVVCAFMNDAAIDAALSVEPTGVSDVYAAGVALELRDERRVAAATLARLGVRVIDVPARDLTTALIDQYLLIKQRGLL
jgi:uncharacterized protein (DUF58 family)